MAVIHIKVTGHRAEKVSEDWLASGSAGVDSLIIDTIDSSWEGYNIAAAFKVQDQLYYSVVDNNIAIIPAAALVNDFVLLDLYGTKAGAGDTELRYSTNYVPLRPKAGPGTGGVTPPEPSESLYNEIRDIAETAEATANEVAAAAARGDFDGEPGPQGETGPQGPQGETGPQGPQGIPGEVSITELQKAFITGTASGGNTSITDGADIRLKNIILYGQSTQAGSPTPANPVPIVTAPVNITVSDGADGSQTAAGPLLLGLVSNHRDYTTYTDTNNISYYADSADISSGLITRRTQSYTFDGSESWALHTSGAFLLNMPLAPEYAPLARVNSICTSFITANVVIASMPDQSWRPATRTPGGLIIYFRYDGITGDTAEDRIEGFKAWLYNNPQTIIYGISNPYTEIIPAETLTALRALHTYYGANTITIAPWGTVDYCRDTGLYIGGLI
jgi:hypothetical protein